MGLKLIPVEVAPLKALLMASIQSWSMFSESTIFDTMGPPVRELIQFVISASPGISSCMFFTGFRKSALGNTENGQEIN